VTLATGDRILIKNQVAETENGIYRVNATGAPTRDYDMDVAAEFVGAVVYVVTGTHAGTVWCCTNTTEPTIGVTAITWAESPVPESLDFASILLTESDPPAAPAASHQRLYLNSSNLNAINSAGTVRVIGGGSGGAALTVEEVDGTPTVSATKLVLPNGTLGVVGTVATYTPAAGAGAIAESLIDAKGDLIVGSAADTAARLAVGTTGHVLTVDPGEALGMKWAAGGGGSSDSRPYLDSGITLHGTYGDDFNGSNLGAKWTRLNQVAGAENFEAASWMQLDMSRSTAARGYYQTLTNADEVLVDLAFALWGGGTDALFGPFIVSSDGAGVGMGVSLADATLRLIALTAYARASDMKTLAAAWADKAWDRGIKIWMRLEQRAGMYIARVSLNGSWWAFESPGGIPGAFTPAKVGFGRVYGASATATYRLLIDRFNVTTKAYGSNLVITPTSGTATYTASSEYSGSYLAGNAANGSRTSGEWAASGTGLPLWWKVTWSAGQSLNRVILFGRATEQMGNAHLTFSDGSTVLVPGPITSGGTAVDFATKTGITTMEIFSDGGGNGFPGFFEVEAYLAS